MSFCFRCNTLYTSRPGIADNIIVQTIIPFLGYSIPKGVWEMPVLENAGTGNCRYWKMPVLENTGIGKCRYWKIPVLLENASVANAKNFNCSACSTR